MINGLPYNPYAQKTVEKLHNTIRNILLAIYLVNIQSFNIEFSIIKVINIYNNSNHKTTKFSLNEIVLKKYLK